VISLPPAVDFVGAICLDLLCSIYHFSHLLEERLSGMMKLLGKKYNENPRPLCEMQCTRW
jgi:hypothetical protein